MDDAIDQLIVDVATDGPVAHLRVSGELDVHTAPSLSDAITRAFDAGAASISIDTSDLKFCDSSGIQVLVQAREEALTRDGTVSLIGVHGPVEKVLSVTGLLELFR